MRFASHPNPIISRSRDFHFHAAQDFSPRQNLPQGIQYKISFGSSGTYPDKGIFGNDIHLVSEIWKRQSGTRHGIRHKERRIQIFDMNFHQIISRIQLAIFVFHKNIIGASWNESPPNTRLLQTQQFFRFHQLGICRKNGIIDRRWRKIDMRASRIKIRL